MSNASNVFQEAIKHYSDNEEFVNNVKEVIARSQDKDGKYHPGTLRVLSVNGTLKWFVDSVNGQCPSEKFGAGEFKGEQVPPSFANTFVLTITHETCTLVLSKDGMPNHTYDGKGHQHGVTGVWAGSF
ncbi:hypothetical protein ACEPAF_2173 [Sanghuangporus sanghuang]